MGSDRFPKLLVYGATGYSGRLILEEALSRGLKPVIAGRDQRAIVAMAAACGLEWAAARMDEPAPLRLMTASATVLLNAAGPFAATSVPLIEACIATGTHYLDITGDAGTIEPVAGRDHDALLRGVMLMPAVGFDVVASDCLLAHVARRLPGATALKLGFDKSEPTSPGSMKTILEMGGKGVLVRREGLLMRVAPGSRTHYFDYGNGPQISLPANLGDVSSAFYSTGIPNVEAYMRATLPMWGAAAADQYWGWLLATPPWQAFLKAHVDWLVPDPSAQARSAGWGVLVAEATDAGGACVRARLRTGDVYSFTAQSAIGVAERCLAGEWKPGFQTPSRVYGPDFALSFGGARRQDL